METTKITERVKRLEATIAQACARVGREPGDLRLVIVTKSADFEQIEEVLGLGYHHFGENHVQQLRKVAAQVTAFVEQHSDDPALAQEIHWHMIGHLQRNKVRQILPIVSLIHSVDTLRLAEEINSSAARTNLAPRVLLQVNASNEPQKYGVPIGAATHLAEQIETLPHLKVIGLMTMAPLTRNTEVIRACFARTRDLFYEMRGEKIVGDQFTEVSRGMSSDYEIAIEEGATILRIGSAIFAG